MTIMRLLTSFSLWLYISTTTTQSVGSDFTFLYTALFEERLTLTQVLYIQTYLQGGHPAPGQDDAQLDLQTCRENLQGLTSENNNKDAEISRLSQILDDEQNSISDPVCAERNEGSDVLTELQKVQVMLQEMQAKDTTINHTLTIMEAELDRYKDEVATLTGKIQDQQSVIEGLQNFSITLPDEVATLSGSIQAQNNEIQRQHTDQVQFQNTCSDEIDGLSERINDQQNQTEWLKMQYDELKEISGNQCVGPFEIFEYHCYHYNHTMVTWSEARKVCKDRRGDLAVDNFNTLKNLTIANFSGVFPWVGVRDNLWLNGREPQQQQWYTGELDMKNQCGVMTSSDLWNDPCHYTKPFICQVY